MPRRHAPTPRGNCVRGRRPQVGDDGLPGDRGLALGDQRAAAVGEVDVEPRAEPDHADALAGADRGALAHERHDAPRDEAGDLDDADPGAAGGADQEAVALVVLARLVEVGVEEEAGAVGDALDAAGRPGCGSRGSRTRS